MHIKIKTLVLSILIIVILFGGIAVAQQLGYWQTESAKEPVKISTGSFAGSADPADIRGSYTFADISKNFNVPLEDLANAFLVLPSEAAVFKCKDLEAQAGKFGDLEVGTASVRAFVAYYLGMEVAATETDDDIPPSAIKVILEKGKPTAAQRTKLEALGK